MSSEVPPPKPSGNICTPRLPQGSDPDAHPHATETLAPATSATPPPSAALPPLKASEVQVGSPTHRAAQDSDTEAHPHVQAPSPSAARPATGLAPPKQKNRPKIRFVTSFSLEAQASLPAAETSHVAEATELAAPKHKTRRKIRIINSSGPVVQASGPATLTPAPARTPSELAPPKSKTRQVITSTSRVVQGSDPTVETTAPPPSTSPMPPEPRRNPPRGRGASIKARDALVKSTATHADAHHHGAKSLPLSSSGQPAGSAIRGHSTVSLMNDVEDTSAKTVPCENISSNQNVEKKVSYQMLTEPDVGKKKSHQLSPHLKLIVANLSKTWSHKVDLAVNNFRTTMKECSSEKPWQDEADKASLKLAETLKEIQNEQSRVLCAELSKEPIAVHLEKPSRLTSIINYLRKQNLLERCDLLECEEVAVGLLLAVHNLGHINDIQSISSKDQEKRDLMAIEHCKAGDIYYSEGSDIAAFLAAGGAIKACSLVAEHKYQYSFAIIRPPGHHAGLKGPTGFCLFNNVAIAASYLLEHHKMKKIMIIDWDVHHGNGTEEIFYKDERVLFFSVHRYGGRFYPFAPVGCVEDTGEGSGTGYNVNVCWQHDKIRDIDYLTVWKHVLIPLLEEFQPEIILISAGFDAAEGDSLGDCCVTPSGFAALLNMILGFGPIVMVLEGGYNLQCISKSAAACVKVLLGDTNFINCDMDSLPYDTTWKTILKIREVFRKFWKAFESEISKEVISKSILHVTKGLETMPCSAKAEVGSRRTGRSKKMG